MTAEPKVSVITPVYNGARFIADAMESVLAQSYGNWEYIVADNCSTDDTFALAQRIAARDPRVRVVRTEPHLPIIANWNRALALASPDAVYIKELHADDFLFPECLARFVGLMERHPNVAVASSFVTFDAAVSNFGVPLGRGVVPGAEVIRGTLMGDWYLFGSPSSLILRASCVRAAAGRWYDETVCHADVDACFRALDGHDFGFVHQVLSGIRTHETSQTNTITWRFTTLALEWCCFLLRYGPVYLTPEEYRRRHRQVSRHYRRRIARRLVGGAGREYWRFHRDRLARYGYRLRVRDVAIGAATEMLLWAVDMRHGLRSLAKIPERLRAARAHLAGGATLGQRLRQTALARSVHGFFGGLFGL